MTNEVDWPDLDAVRDCLRRAAATGLASVTSLGLSGEGRDIPMAIVTDRSVDDDEKEVFILVTAEHGEEKSGTTSVLRTLEWLVSDDETAKTVRRRQVAYIIPCLNVDGYLINRGLTPAGADPYVDYSLESGPTIPEAKALWELVERTVPDAMVNLHGGRFEDMYRSFIMNTVSAFHPEIAEDMDRAADEAGYPQPREWEFEQFPNVADPLSRPSRPGRPAVPFSSNIAAAAKRFHTLGMLLHTDYEDEFLVRIKRLLEVGSGRWPSEYYPGYPNRVLASQGNALLTACGKTAGERRRSRAELRANADGLALLSASCRPGRSINVLHRKTKPFIFHGAAIRHRIPKGSTIGRVSLNGVPLPASEGHGYIHWDDTRWTNVQVNILEGWAAFSTRAKGGDTLPPDLAVTMVEYDPPA